MLYLADHIKEPPEGRLFSVFTTGGDSLPIQRLNVTDKVMDQSDKSLNKRLWGRYPFELSNHWDIVLQLTTLRGRLERASTSTPEDLARAMLLRDLEERYQLYVIVYDTALLIETTLPIKGRFMAFNRFDAMRTDIMVDPADIANDPVSLLQPLENHYDKRENGVEDWEEEWGKEWGDRLWAAEATAHLIWMARLMGLAPFHASPCLFTGAKASELGLAQEQGKLLTRLAQGCLRLGEGNGRFYHCAKQFALLAIGMRYIHHPHLITAVEAYRDACQGMHPHPTGARVPIPHLDKTLERLRSKSKTVTGWAHEHCLTEAHEGCMGPDV
ncbi:hypothetical protein A1Q2_05741 [Trichosporon asahii var. asahii CBS 8904]|uniref:Uncharacterized protein n=1 Tax=Trichosporon asahii var. asahii (strain CBS 8904) TaxID=1220162 RepID=K1VTF9_TRIAC|nr:hypothetical protein A1Q2_05741 [Trichosporon asahii var. asahii CBS 8904]